MLRSAVCQPAKPPKTAPNPPYPPLQLHALLAAALSSHERYERSSLPFASPQNPQNSPKPPKTPKLPLQLHAVCQPSKLQNPLLHCCLVIAVMWPHCCQARHAIGKTMSQQAMACSRDKHNENKKEIKAIVLSSTNCMEAACMQACASCASCGLANGRLEPS